MNENALFEGVGKVERGYRCDVHLWLLCIFWFMFVSCVWFSSNDN